MTAKRLFGYIFIGFSILLVFSIIGQLPKIFITLVGLFRIFTGSLDSYQIGEVLGATFFWIVYFGVTITLLTYGLRWIKNKTTGDES